MDWSGSAASWDNSCLMDVRAGVWSVMFVRCVMASWYDSKHMSCICFDVKGMPSA